MNFSLNTPHRANTGGPSSRTRKESVSASLLDDLDGPGHCRRLITLGLRFPEDSDPVIYVEKLLEANGYVDAESFRQTLLLPPSGLICSPAPEASRHPVSALNAQEVLEQAVLLGLCNAQGYFPQRPVLWTRTSLSRSLHLYDPGGFYQ